MPGASSSAATHRPESSASAGSAAARAAALGFQRRIGGEAVAGLLRFGEAERAGADDFEPARRKQVVEFGELAVVVGRGDDPAAQPASQRFVHGAMIL